MISVYHIVGSGWMSEYKREEYGPYESEKAARAGLAEMG